MEEKQTMRNYVLYEVWHRVLYNYEQVEQALESLGAEAVLNSTLEQIADYVEEYFNRLTKSFYL